MFRFCLVVVCLVGFWRYLWSHWVSESVIAKLPSADKKEVRELLGDPTGESPGIDYEKWSYRRPTRLVEFRVFFAPDGKVMHWSYDR
jgi:hypothetical protein